jgi:hypothetical protein
MPVAALPLKRAGARRITFAAVSKVYDRTEPGTIDAISTGDVQPRSTR